MENRTKTMYHMLEVKNVNNTFEGLPYCGDQTTGHFPRCLSPLYMSSGSEKSAVFLELIYVFSFQMVEL